LLFLGTIAFLPYPTSLLAVRSLGHKEAVIFYAICAGAAGLGEGLIWLYATRRGSGLTDPSVGRVRLITRCAYFACRSFSASRYLSPWWLRV
jgi:hypothetical protein